MGYESNNGGASYCVTVRGYFLPISVTGLGLVLYVRVGEKVNGELKYTYIPNRTAAERRKAPALVSFFCDTADI